MDKYGQKNIIIYVVKVTVISILVALFLEITLFNFRHYQSLGYKNIDNVTTTLLGLAEDENGIYKSSNGGEIGIEMVFPYQDVRNIYLDLGRVVPDQYVGNAIDMAVLISDEGNSLYYEVWNKVTDFEYISSRYLTIHPTGKVDRVKIIFDYVYDTELVINGLELNAERPLRISEIRIAFTLFVFVFFFIFRANSKLYTIKINRYSRGQRGVLLIYAIAQILLIIFVCNQAKINNEPYDIYAELSKALAKGQVYLDAEPPQKLVELANPYDTAMRLAHNVTYLWDHAYFNGKYYVYFGITPVIVFYLPYYLITGNAFPGYAAVCICSVLIVIGIILLIRYLAERFFGDISFLLVLLLIMVTINGAGLWFLIMYPRFYAIPILTSLTGLIWGIYLWVTSVKKEQLVLWRVALGSLFIASIAGGRVQMLMAGFLAFPIFGAVLIKEPIKNGISKKWLTSITAFIMPLALVAAGIMYYNYIRFGSVVDFGANYNLTTNDMTNRGFVFDRTGLGIFTYLFQTPNTVATFPFIHKCKFLTGYMGKTISEDMYGGLITCNLILGVIFALGSVKRELKDKGLLSAVILMIFSGLVILVADTQMAGILQRYIGDFAIFFFGASIIILFTLYEKLKTAEQKRIMYQIVLILCAMSLIYNMALAVACSELSVNNPEFYEKLSSSFQFWL